MLLPPEKKKKKKKKKTLGGVKVYKGKEVRGVRDILVGGFL